MQQVGSRVVESIYEVRGSKLHETKGIVALDPSDVVSLTNRGESHFKLGIYPLANADFDQAISLDPKDENKWAKRARMLREQIRLVSQGKKK